MTKQEPALSLHLKKFNDKVRLMNQSGGRDLTLSAAEARSLHSDLFDLLNHCSQLSKQLAAQPSESAVSVSMDGGTF